ncbi:hypothetical protein [Desulfohalovibrio reitneri]|uniref:hypothetical protein n=1 Tax=Desulfohalovibrio reitneri TaxID=1307759 RepID=UPI000689C279|nr:hypothetical protein [Desulfohalovibrio reitneri]
MSQDLQHLIERIHAEGVAKAEAEAEEIVAGARKKAARIVREAEDKARDIKERAEEESKIFEERSRRTLEQAARDLLISVGRGVEHIMDGLVAEAVTRAMDDDTVRDMLRNLTERCALGQGQDIAVLVSPEEEKELISFFADMYRDKMRQGIELHTDQDILKGFRVSFKNDSVYLDFTDEAVAEALSAFLRPHLAEIVSHAAQARQRAEEACKVVECPPQEDQEERGGDEG